MALDSDVALLRAVPVLSLIGHEGLRLLAFATEARILRAGDTLFRRGEPADGGFVVRTGSIALDGGAGAPVVVGSGALIGELALVVETTRAATATAREPTSALKIGRALFRRMLEEYPDAAIALHRDLAGRLDATVAELAPVRDRLLAIDRERASGR